LPPKVSFIKVMWIFLRKHLAVEFQE